MACFGTAVAQGRVKEGAATNINTRRSTVGDNPIYRIVAAITNRRQCAETPADRERTSRLAMSTRAAVLVTMGLALVSDSVFGLAPSGRGLARRDAWANAAATQRCGKCQPSTSATTTLSSSSSDAPEPELIRDDAQTMIERRGDDELLSALSADGFVSVKAIVCSKLMSEVSRMQVHIVPHRAETSRRELGGDGGRGRAVMHTHNAYRVVQITETNPNLTRAWCGHTFLHRPTRSTPPLVRPLTNKPSSTLVACMLTIAIATAATLLRQSQHERVRCPSLRRLSVAR